MPTREDRYAAASARVHAKIDAARRERVGYQIDDSGKVRWSTGTERAAQIENALAAIELRWFRAKTDDEREGAVREAEALAEPVAPKKAASGCERDAGVFDYHGPGNIKDELETVRSLIQQLDADIRASRATDAFKTAWRGFVDEFDAFHTRHEGWFSRLWYSEWEKVVEYRRRALAWREKFASVGGTPSGPEDTPPETRTDLLGKLGTLALVGGGIFAAYKIGSALLGTRVAERPPARQASTAARLNRQLAITAEDASARNAKLLGFGPNSMCPVCHRYKNLDENGRIEPHEYPSGGMCPGEGRMPLWPHGGPSRAPEKKPKGAKPRVVPTPVKPKAKKPRVAPAPKPKRKKKKS
jgi:hypothetical protein